MRRLIIVILLVFTLTGCMSADDYYTKEDFDNALATQQALFESQLEAQRLLLERTPVERYITHMLSETFTFAKVGDTVEGTVESWDYGFIIIELETATTVEIVMLVVAPDGEWDLNIYFGGAMGGANLQFNDIKNSDVFRVTFPAGFNTIEIDSYADVTYNYKIRIRPVL